MPETDTKPTGLPKYTDPTKLEIKIQEYFNPDSDNMRKVKKVIGNKKDGYTEIEIPVPTITGLVLYCGFDSRQSFYDYEKKSGFLHIIKRARTLMECTYEEMLAVGNYAGAIFALKNFGWTEKQEIEVKGSLSFAVSKVDYFPEVDDKTGDKTGDKPSS